MPPRKPTPKPARIVAARRPKLAKAEGFSLGGGGFSLSAKATDARPKAGTHRGKKKLPALPVENDATAETADLKAAFYEAKAKNAARMALHTGVDYYAVLCFNNAQDCETFLASLPTDVEEYDEIFLDGYTVAQHMGIPLHPSPLPPPDNGPVARWLNHAMLPSDPPPAPAKPAKPAAKPKLRKSQPRR